jgi:peptidoglycan hydrolase-like protein with peptidoglycan-binding domain
VSKRVVAAGAVVAIAAGGGAVLVMSRSGAQRPTHQVAAVATGTSRVTRTDLRTTQQFGGTLGYPAASSLVAGTRGQAYTRLPAPGAVIRQGQALYEVDGVSVPLLYGARPAWRAMARGSTPGPDIAQLNTALVALGYARSGRGDRHFTATTAAAVRRWQRARGVTVTGAVDLGQVVFAAGPVRVQAVHGSVGSPPEPGAPLLEVTGTRHVVVVPMPVDQAFLVHLHDQVTVTLPDGATEAPGTVSAISPVATQQADPNTGRPGESQVEVTVSLTDAAAAGSFTIAPITLSITVAKADGVLAVPVSALLARPGGGYAVTIVDGSARSEVAVQTGLFADTLVEVSGAGLAEGAVVEVPAS